MDRATLIIFQGDFFNLLTAFVMQLAIFDVCVSCSAKEVINVRISINF